MTDAASDWNVTLIVGSANKGGKTCAYVWRSLDNGAAWRTVVVPQTNGAGWALRHDDHRLRRVHAAAGVSRLRRHGPLRGDRPGPARARGRLHQHRHRSRVGSK
jgi:hypothetical protein